MSLKKLWEWFYDPDKALSLRSFALTSLLVGVTLSIIFVWDIFIGESVEKLLMLGSAVIALFLVVGFSVKFREAYRHFLRGHDNQ